ncbi:AfsR/SARP family transcriptional regulator [Streptomyces melanogenes]|uniref:AfsR/SARP family transcriptional regulator n=1 Tax=Streptomyces melanogenes TaxID=67326 RepID=UPI00378E96A4
MEFFVLGAVGIRTDDAVVSGGSPQQQATLAALALRAGHVVPLHELMNDVWGEAAPGSAVMILRTNVWKLRKLLENNGGDPQVLASANDGYRFTAEPLRVDALRAEHLATEAAHARKAERYDECAELLSEAVVLWRGEPLAGLPGPFADRQRSRLAELRLNLLEERFDLDILLGRPAQVIPALTGFIRERPLRERPYGFLMRALFAAGRQADALAVFADARDVLAAELGLDPGPELQLLHQRILQGDPALLAPVRTQAPAIPAARPKDSDDAGRSATGAFARPAQLPADVADFSGRTNALATLHTTLTDEERGTLAIATVSGMGGIGKSALALRVAHQVKDAYPDGHLYADLRGTSADATTPAAVLAGFLSALGVPRQEIPGSVEDRARLFRTVLDNRRVLLLLDDARDTAQVKPLLPGAVRCGVIVTSRARLAGVPSGSHVQLAEFTRDEALSLLRHIAGAERIDREESAAEELVGACAHLPLAVRIVAARLSARPGWTVAQLAARLADERRRLTELQADDLAVAAVFELGYRQLTEEQARAFRSLAPVTWPSISLEAAAAALDLSERDAEELLEALVDAALLESPEPGRYRYHDLGRDFALHLPRPEDASADDHFTVARRLLHHLLHRAAAAFQRMVPGDPVHSTIADTVAEPGNAFAGLAEAREWVVAESDCAVHTVRLLLRGPGSPDPVLLTMAADLLVALSSFGQDIPYAKMAVTSAELADTATRAGAHRAAGRAHFICGNAALQATRLRQARTHSELAAEACRRAGDRTILQQACNDLGVIAQFEQRYDDAAAHFDQALALAREQGQRSAELITTLNAALARIRGGRAAEALPSCEEALAALRTMADPHGVAHALCVRGQALHELNRPHEALDSYTECLKVCEAERIPGQRAQAHYRSAETLRVLGRIEAALDMAGQAVSYFRTTPDRARDRGYALLIHARTSSDAGHPEEARAHAAEALEVFTKAGLPEAAEAAARLKPEEQSACAT